MKKKKKKRETPSCPWTDALEVFGGEDALRARAGHRAVFSVWKTRELVPWAVVGPELLTRWRDATHGRGLVPEDTAKRQAGAMLLRILQDAAKDVGERRPKKGERG